MWEFMDVVIIMVDKELITTTIIKIIITIIITNLHLMDNHLDKP